MAPTLAFSRERHQSQLTVVDDRQLLLQMQASDEQALDELIRRKTKPLIQVAYRILSDMEESRDVVQIAFVRIWEKRSSYDPKWSPNTWIYRIVTNLAIDHLRSQKSRDRIAEPLRLHLQHVSAGSEPATARSGEAEVDGIFGELVRVLTEKQRAIFVLREIEGLSSAEVAQVVGCKESTVRNHLFNARKVLREELVRAYPEYAPTQEGA